MKGFKVVYILWGLALGLFLFGYVLDWAELLDVDAIQTYREIESIVGFLLVTLGFVFLCIKNLSKLSKGEA